MNWLMEANGDPAEWVALCIAGALLAGGLLVVVWMGRDRWKL